MTATEYCREVRIAQARELLQEGDMPIKTIAASLGYSEVPSFARVFRKRTGQTPAAYRRQYGIAEPALVTA